MKKDPSLIFRLFLMFGDAFAIVFAFAFSYYFRTHIDPRPYYFEAEHRNFVFTILTLIPVWLIVLSIFGLYRSNIFLAKQRFPEIIRLLGASLVGIMLIITYDFFSQNNLFPVRIIAVHSAILCFLSLLFMRFLLKFLRRRILRTERGITKILIIGNHINTSNLSSYISSTPETGYKIVGIISNYRFIPTHLRKLHFSSLKDALRHTRPDIIFQTDEHHTDYVYQESVHRHLQYYFVPSTSALSSHIGDLELIGDTPAILVKTTPLVNGATVTKRLMDLLLGSLATLIFSPLMLLIWLIIRCSDPKYPGIFVTTRLSKHNRRVKIFKFRTIKPQFNGMTPEEAFTSLGQPQLIKAYRANGDFLPHDPRISRFGAFLRRTSLDELPQLFNVLKGDISLVGPRALVPGELKTYGNRSLVLSVKSGMTGLAQVSGRRDISFEQRRALDIYYVQNWSLLLDFQILIRTIFVVLTAKGAK